MIRDLMFFAVASLAGTAGAATSVAATVPAPGGPPPAGTTITDDTGTISVDVPESWVRRTAPDLADDGGERPVIVAAPDFDSYNAMEAPGIWIAAMPAPDAARWATELSLRGTCETRDAASFDNGSIVGEQRTWTDCDGSGFSSYIQVTGSSIDGETGVFVQISLAGTVDVVSSMALESLSAAPLPAAPTPVTATDADDQSLADATVPDDVERLVEQYGVLAVSVPATFDERLLTNYEGNDDASNRPAIYASTDLGGFFAGVSGFYTDWAVPGVYLISVPNVEAGTFLGNFGVRLEGCDGSRVRPFDNGSMSGLVQEWSGCGNERPAVAFAFAVSPPDRSATIFGFVKSPDGDPASLRIVLNSIEVLSP